MTTMSASCDGCGKPTGWVPRIIPPEWMVVITKAQQLERAAGLPLTSPKRIYCPECQARGAADLN